MTVLFSYIVNYQMSPFKEWDAYMYTDILKLANFPFLKVIRVHHDLSKMFKTLVWND